MTKLYKTGELARLTGVSPRTVRYYDIKGLLSLVEYSHSGYRKYDNSSVERLQRIQMLKYLGFSLEQIEEVVNREQLFLAVKNGLKEKGMFCCSTVGRGHMEELNTFVKDFSKEIEL